MMIIILLGVALAIGVYFYMQKSQNSQNIKKEEPSSSVLDFYPSENFEGSMSGYVFKMDHKGLGYYLDNK